MSGKTVEDRVVAMKFDNKDFEKNVQTSLNTLDKLNKGLALTESAKGLEGIGNAAKKVDLSGVQNGVEAIRVKFSALEVMAVTALSNITNSALNAGKRIASSLTIDPIKSGFEEYETQINAVQTILANTESKGSTLKNVNEALDELNTYADKTIYNFTEMTRNIGTFTAAGVDLDTSVQAIKGIANLAAVSGSNSQQASTAMYQLSQALASGTVKLMDWNSVVNAGMGGQVFQDSLKETARVHGIAIDEMIKDEGSFRETLSEGWLTSEILTETLAKFTGDLNEEQLKTMGYTEEQITSIMKMGQTANDAATKVKTFTQLFDTLKEAAQSGWTQSWEIIVGDFEEAKELLTEVSDAFGALIGASADARNSMLEEWKELGGRTALIEACRNALQAVASVIEPVKEGFREIFPAVTGKQLFNITKTLQEFTKGLKLSDQTSKDLKNTFKGMFAVVDIIGQAFTAIVKAIFPMTKGLKDASGGLLSFTGSFGEWLVKLDESLKSTDFFTNAIDKVVTTVRTGFTKAQEIMTMVLEKFQEFGAWAKEKLAFPGIETFHNLLQRIHDRMAEVMHTSETLKGALNDAFNAVVSSAAFTTLTSGLEKVVTFLQSLWDGIKIIGKGISDAIGSLTSGFADAMGGADFNSIFDVINGGLLAGLLAGITKFVFGLGSITKNAGGFLKNLSGIFEGLTGSLKAMQQNLKAGTLMKIAGAIALLTASLVVLSLIDSEKLTVAITAISTLFVELMASMAVFSKISGNTDTSLGKFAFAMIGVSVAVLVLATAMEKLSGLDWPGVAKGLVSVAGLTTILVVTAEVLSKSSGKMMTGMTGLLIFTFAIRNLVRVVEELGALDMNTLGKGLLGVGALVAELAAFMVAAKFGKMGVGTGIGILALSAAIAVLATSVQTFGAMETEALLQGLIALGAVLTELSLFIQLNSGAKGMITTATGMVILGAAMNIFAHAVGQFGNMPLENMVQGLAGMAGVLTTLTIALNLMPKNMIGIGIGMVAIGGALLILSNALGTMGGMSWEEIAKGLVALAGGLGVIALAVNLMNGALAGAAAMLVISAALAIFAPTLMILSTMSWEEIGKGLVALAGSFVVLGIAGAVLGPLVPAILGLAGAFALIGVGIAAAGAGLLAMGVGMTALAAGFAALATLGSAGAIAVVAAITIIIEGVAAMIPVILLKIGEGLISLAEVIIQAAPVLVEAVVTVIVAVVAGLVATIPVVVDGVFQLLAALLTTIVEYTPTIVGAVMTIIAEILVGIALGLPDIIQAGVDIMVAFIQGVASMSVQLIDAAFQAMITFINGLADCIDTNTPLLIDAMNRLMDSIINAAILVLTNSIERMKERGKAIMNSGLIQGIKDKIEDAKKAIQDLLNKVLNAVREKTQAFKDAAKNVIEGFVQGIKDKFQDAVNAASDLGKKILDSAKSALGINSPSKEFAEIGRWSDLGMVQGLKKYASDVYGAASDVGSGALDAMQDSIGNISRVIDGNFNMDPVIRPTLDLSEIASGAKQIGSMFNEQRLAVHGGNIQNGGESGVNGTSYTFNQNNYSPKALSRTEIYRQTKNQFATLKGAVNNA